MMELIDGISVIIPVYNGELYLEKLVENIINQCCDNVIAIISDNGSSDKTHEIMFSLKEKYTNRVKLVFPVDYETRWLPSNSRQQGMDAVETQFFTFCDVDDQWEWQELQRIAVEMKEEEIDVFGGGYYFRDTNWNIVGDKRHEYKDAGLENAKYFLDCMCQPRVYRTTYIRDNGISFPKQSYFEDACFSLACLSKGGKIKVDENCIYNYLINPNSFTHKKHTICKNNLPIAWIKEFTSDVVNVEDEIYDRLVNWRCFMLISEIIYQPFIIRIARYSIRDAWNTAKELRNVIKENIDLDSCRVVERQIKRQRILPYKYCVITKFSRILYKLSLDRIAAAICAIVGKLF